MSDKVMYAIAGIVVLAVLVIVLDVACMMMLDMRLAEVPKRAVAIVTGGQAPQPKPTATAPALVKATLTPKPLKVTPTPRPVEATPTPIPPTPIPPTATATLAPLSTPKKVVVHTPTPYPTPTTVPLGTPVWYNDWELAVLDVDWSEPPSWDADNYSHPWVIVGLRLTNHTGMERFRPQLEVDFGNKRHWRSIIPPDECLERYTTDFPAGTTCEFYQIFEWNADTPLPSTIALSEWKSSITAIPIATWTR